MDRSRETAVMFSGGTDSTLTAALMASQFDRVHLITYDRFAFFSTTTNTRVNAEKLKCKYGENKFVHHIINVEKLTEFVFYERYLSNIRRHGFFLLSICGLCKLAMHLRTLIFCLDNKISHVCDGANQGMYLEPAQMANVIKELKKMYARFNVDYTNPVFNFEGPQDRGFADRLHLERVFPDQKMETATLTKAGLTTGCKLHQLGLMPSENVKGTELDRKMQPRCFQFTLFNIFIMWYYLYDHPYEEYASRTVQLYQDKIHSLTGSLEEYVKKGRKSRLSRLIED